MDFHRDELKKVCRVCSRRLKKAKGGERRYVCKEYFKELDVVFHINVSNGNEDIHPLHLCHPCEAHCKRECSTCS